MKMSKVFHDALWDYTARVTVTVSRQRGEREEWMGPRDEDFARCEAALAKLEKLWTYEKDDLEALKALHRKFLDLYQQDRPDDAEWTAKDIDELIDSLRDKWKKA